MEKRPIATIVMDSGAHIVVELYPEHAPNTVNSFIHLASKGLFDNREIKRIVKGFVIQPSYSNFDDLECDYALNGEFRANGYDNGLVLTQGTVAMGGDGQKTASGSSFFFTLEDHGDRLDGKYAAFGQVVEGFEELRRIENVETTSVDSGMEGVTITEPLKKEVLKTVTIETYGVKYPEPIKL